MADVPVDGSGTPCAGYSTDSSGTAYERVQGSNGCVKTKIVDSAGTNTAAVDASGNVQVEVTNTSIAVTGTLTDITNPINAVIDSGTITTVSTVTAVSSIADGGNSITVDSTQLPTALAAGGGLKIEGVAGGVTVPVTGTITAVTAISNALPAGDNNIGNVDVASALPAGDNNIGNVDIVSGTVTAVTSITNPVAVTDNNGALTVDGTVAVSSITTSVTPGTDAAHLGKAEDAGHFQGDTGVFILGVRNDTPTVRTSDDGDYSPISVDSYGRVELSAEKAEDTAHTSGDKGIMALAVYSTAPGQLAGTASDYGPLTTNQTGRLYTEAASVTGIECQAGEALPVNYAFANVAASQTDSSVVTATASHKIRVLSLAFVAGGTATNITFNSKGGGAGTAISCLFANAANGGAVLPYNPHGWFETNSGEALTVTTGAGSTTGIQLTYIVANP